MCVCVCLSFPPPPFFPARHIYILRSLISSIAAFLRLQEILIFLFQLIPPPPHSLPPQTIPFVFTILISLYHHLDRTHRILDIRYFRRLVEKGSLTADDFVTINTHKMQRTTRHFRRRNDVLDFFRAQLQYKARRLSRFGGVKKKGGFLEAHTSYLQHRPHESISKQNISPSRSEVCLP